MAAPQTVLELIERFDRNRSAYKSEQYNEARLRIEFLNPMFEALGWDVNNKNGYAETYKDVIYEDAIKIGGATKAPDYCFRMAAHGNSLSRRKNPPSTCEMPVTQRFNYGATLGLRNCHLASSLILKSSSCMIAESSLRKMIRQQPPAFCTCPTLIIPSVGRRSPPSSRARRF